MDRFRGTLAKGARKLHVGYRPSMVRKCKNPWCEGAGKVLIGVLIGVFVDGRWAFVVVGSAMVIMLIAYHVVFLGALALGAFGSALEARYGKARRERLERRVDSWFDRWYPAGIRVFITVMWILFGIVGVWAVRFS